MEEDWEPTKKGVEDDKIREQIKGIYNTCYNQIKSKLTYAYYTSDQSSNKLKSFSLVQNRTNINPISSYNRRKR